MTPWTRPSMADTHELSAVVDSKPARRFALIGHRFEQRIHKPARANVHHGRHDAGNSKPAALDAAATITCSPAQSKATHRNGDAPSMPVCNTRSGSVRSRIDGRLIQPMAECLMGCRRETIDSWSIRRSRTLSVRPTGTVGTRFAYPTRYLGDRYCCSTEAVLTIIEIAPRMPTAQTREFDPPTSRSLI
jgi:hypothetical protein